jgi:hypothetical protein
MFSGVEETVRRVDLDYQSEIGAWPLRQAHSISVMKRAGQPSGSVFHVANFNTQSNKVSVDLLL